MQNTMLSRAEIEDQGISDPIGYAMGRWDTDLLPVVADALTAGRTHFAFQPVVTADDPPRIAFYEGLIRLKNDAGHAIPAARFMPLVEDTVAGRALDCAALDMAFAQLRQSRDLRLSVNLSARSLGDGQWRRILEQGLLETGHLGERLIFEISESSAMLLHDSVIRFMHDMQPKGVGFALDGFGAGMTAFRHLNDFLFDLVKIDKSFIKRIHLNHHNQVLVSALVSVAKSFEMFAVADGVESEEEAAFLREAGVDCMQGYLFGTPSPTI
ncbi:MAG: EAL domain-containing protein [Pseudomonadota bacterium]